MGQGFAHLAGQLITSARTSGVRPDMVQVSGLLRMVLHGQGLFLELLLQKDGGIVMGHIKDTRTCEDIEVYMCTGGGQSRKRGCSTGCSTLQLHIGKVPQQHLEPPQFKFLNFPYIANSTAGPSGRDLPVLLIDFDSRDAALSIS